jgi:predicted Rossmann fold flavoprotein
LDFGVIVIGGGPAGMMAAGRAAERGKRVLLLDANEILGRKLLISGKGRCNIANAGTIDDYLDNFGRTGPFLRNVFSRIFNAELRDFFEERGVPLTVERGRRLFPSSGRSKDILEALKRYLKEKGVKVVLKSNVEDIAVGGSGTKKVLVNGGAEYTAGSIAICTGGLSYPKTGSTGFGFKAAERLGHNVIRPEPALVPLVTESHMPKAWQGVSLRNVEAAVISEGKKKDKRFGELLFTHFGLSGPIILDLSSSVYSLLKEKRDVCISINLKPALNKSKLDERLVREFSRHSAKTLKNVLKGLLPLKRIDGFIKLCGLDPELRANQVTKAQRQCLVERLAGLTLKIKGARPIEEAIVTKGGVDTKEIDPKTMESKLVKGLFFAGEVIDVDAKTGGYNMQAAFSTGYVCGDNL